ncbi:MAG: choice-of-anchor K domain-containing protein [bacterium]
MKKILFPTLAVIAGLNLTAYAITFSGTAIGSWNDPNTESGWSHWNIANNDHGGVSKVTWGDPAYCFDKPSYLQFDGAGSDSDALPPSWSSDQYVNNPFLLGSLTYYNGTQWSNTGLEGVDLAMKVSITGPLPAYGDLPVLEFGMGINNTINPNGDTVLFLDVPDPIGFTYGGQNYSFEILGFSLDNGINMTRQIYACEGGTKLGNFYARISSTGGGTTVPDNCSTVVLLGLVAIGLGALKAKFA